MKRIILLTAVGLLLAALAAADGLCEGWLYEVTEKGLVITGFDGPIPEAAIPPELDGYRVTGIAREAFAGRAELRRLVVPEGVTFIEAEAFRGCVGLSEIEFNAVNCAIPPVWIYGGDRNYGVFSGAGASSPDGLRVTFGDRVAVIPAFLFDTASTGEYGHDGQPCAYVTVVRMSGGVKRVDERAFVGCRDLRAIEFGAAVQSVGPYAFWQCTALTGADFDDALLTIEEGAFSGDAALMAVTFGNRLTDIGAGAFRDCAALEALELVNPLSTIGENAFRDCAALSRVTIPETLNELGANAFYGCVNLAEVNFRAKHCAVPEVWIYGSHGNLGVFSGAGSAAPGGLKVEFGEKVAEVPAHLFDTASIEEYGHTGEPYAYLTEARFNDGVRSVGEYAFRGCLDLETAIFFGADAEIAEGAFDGCNAVNFHFVCPDGGAIARFADDAGIAHEALSADGGRAWTCKNGHVGNTGNFCIECGAARPEAAACPACGAAFSEGQGYRFCPWCGAPLNGKDRAGE